MNQGLVFVEAHSEDWPEIWPVFRSVIASGDTYPYPPDMAESEAQAIWMRHGSREATYVARSDGRVVATAYVKPNQPGLGDHVANAGWMVDPAHQRHGVGRGFAGYVIDQARRLGYEAMQFNSVVATNEVAVRLWESLGFEIVGTIPDAFRHATAGLQPIHVMYRRL